MSDKKHKQKVSPMGKEILIALSSGKEFESLAIALKLHQTRESKRRLSSHSLRQSLKRLERQGLIACREEIASDSNEAELKVKYYRLTGKGLDFIKVNR